MVLEEYDPELVYIKGPDNIVTDALSRLDLIPEEKNLLGNLIFDNGYILNRKNYLKMLTLSDGALSRENRKKTKDCSKQYPNTRVIIER